MILGLLKIQTGSISIFEKMIDKERIAILKQTGSLIEQPSLYAHLTGKENLEIYRLIYGLPSNSIDHALDIVRLKQAAGKKTKAYSLGMKQRLSIAIALLHDPQLLILDEPTNGLDPGGIIETRELIIDLNRKYGKTIVVSSHLLSEIEKMSTHVGIIHKGKLLFQDALHQLKSLQSKNAVVEIEVDDTVKAAVVLNGNVDIKTMNGTRFTVAFESREKTAALNSLLVNAGIKVSQLQLQQHNLEKMFVEITGGN
ncbi:MAG: ABC transporter ATP-binding protein [Agriterribacter sp.]